MKDVDLSDRDPGIATDLGESAEVNVFWRAQSEVDLLNRKDGCSAASKSSSAVIGGFAGSGGCPGSSVRAGWI